MLFGHNGMFGLSLPGSSRCFFSKRQENSIASLEKNELTELRFARGRSRLKGGWRCLKFSPDLLLDVHVRELESLPEKRGKCWWETKTSAKSQKYASELKFGTVTDHTVPVYFTVKLTQLQGPLSLQILKGNNPAVHTVSAQRCGRPN